MRGGARMRLELHYRSDVDLSQPAMQVEIRNHIARCLRDYAGGEEGVITLVHDDVVDTVIGPPDYIEQSQTSVGKLRMKRDLRCCARSTTNPYSGHHRSPKPDRTSLLRSPLLLRSEGSALRRTA